MGSHCSGAAIFPPFQLEVCTTLPTACRRVAALAGVSCREKGGGGLGGRPNGRTGPKGSCVVAEPRSRRLIFIWTSDGSGRGAVAGEREGDTTAVARLSGFANPAGCRAHDRPLRPTDPVAVSDRDNLPADGLSRRRSARCSCQPARACGPSGRGGGCEQGHLGPPRGAWTRSHGAGAVPPAAARRDALAAAPANDAARHSR